MTFQPCPRAEDLWPGHRFSTLRGLIHRAHFPVVTPQPNVAYLVEGRVGATFAGNSPEGRMDRERRADPCVRSGRHRSFEKPQRAVGHEARPLRRADRLQGWSCVSGITRIAGIQACKAESSPVVAASRWSPFAHFQARRPRPRAEDRGKRPSGSAPDRVNSSVWQKPGPHLHEHLAAFAPRS